MGDYAGHFWSCNVSRWSVNINNLEYNSTTNTITLSVPDGTYPYTIKAPDGYTVTSSTNPVQVSGGAVDVIIQFVKNQ